MKFFIPFLELLCIWGKRDTVLSAGLNTGVRKTEFVELDGTKRLQPTKELSDDDQDEKTISQLMSPTFMTGHNRRWNNKSQVISTSTPRELATARGFKWTDNLQELGHTMADNIGTTRERPVLTKNTKSGLVFIHTNNAWKTLYTSGKDRIIGKLQAHGSKTSDTPSFHDHTIPKEEGGKQTYGLGRSVELQGQSVHSSRAISNFNLAGAKQETVPFNLSSTKQETVPFNLSGTKQETVPFNLSGTKQETVPFNLSGTKQETVPYNLASTKQETVPYNLAGTKQETVPYNLAGTKQQTVPYNLAGTKQQTVPYNLAGTKQQTVPYNSRQWRPSHIHYRQKVHRPTGGAHVNVQTSVPDSELQHDFSHGQMSGLEYDKKERLSSTPMKPIIARSHTARAKRENYSRKRNNFVNSQEPQLEDAYKQQDGSDKLNDEMVRINNGGKLLQRQADYGNTQQKSRSLNKFRKGQLKKNKENQVPREVEKTSEDLQLVSDIEQDMALAEKNMDNHDEGRLSWHNISKYVRTFRRYDMRNNLSSLAQDLVDLKIDLL